VPNADLLPAAASKPGERARPSPAEPKDYSDDDPAVVSTVKRVFIGGLTKDQFKMRNCGQRIRLVDIERSHQKEPSISDALLTKNQTE